MRSKTYSLCVDFDLKQVRMEKMSCNKNKS